jgi:hypothetical protein
MWAYEVSGKQVLWHWFSYRRRDRTRPIIGDRRPPSPLDSIQPDHWLPEYTDDLIDLLHVLGRLIVLEPAQADLLNRICAGPLRGADELRAVGAFVLPEGHRSAREKTTKRSRHVGCEDKPDACSHGTAISCMIHLIRHPNRAKDHVLPPTRPIRERRAG